MVLASLAYNAVAACEPAERAVSLIHRMLAARTSGELNDGMAAAVAGQTLVLCDRFDEGGAIFDELLSVSRRMGWPGAYASTMGLRAMLHYRRGALADAEADVSEALTLAGELPHSLPADPLRDREKLHRPRTSAVGTG
jgi:hypothetical protein